MLDLLPRRALFRFELSIPYRAKSPPIDGAISKWDARYLVPPLVEIEGVAPFADVYWAWNEEHLFFAYDVPGRKGPPRCDPEHWWKMDGARFCVDTRDTRDNKRATRFCHFFYVLPCGRSGAGAPLVGSHRMSRAKEPPPVVDASRLRVAARLSRSGYSLELAIPTACLSGWDAAEHPRIGVFYKVKDTVLGSQHLCASDDLGWNVDPSVWATGRLTR
jgi:hypothetical protein